MSQNKLWSFYVLNCSGTFFYFRGKELLQSHLTIMRECPSNNITHILRDFNNSPPDLIYVDSFNLPFPLHLFPNTLIIKDERVLRFFAKTTVQILYRHFSIHQSFLYKKCILSNMHKFLKGKFSHKRWSNPFVKVQQSYNLKLNHQQ